MHVEIMPKSSNYGPLKFGLRRLCIPVKAGCALIRLPCDCKMWEFCILWKSCGMAEMLSHAVWPAQQLPSQTRDERAPKISITMRSGAHVRRILEPRVYWIIIINGYWHDLHVGSVSLCMRLDIGRILDTRDNGRPSCMYAICACAANMACILICIAVMHTSIAWWS